MVWTPHINTSTQTSTNGVPDQGYEVMGQNFVYGNYVTHSLYTHFMYKKTTTPSGADASFDYWDLYITRQNNDSTWLHISNSAGGVIKYKAGTWSDHGTSSPNSISVSGTTVSLSQSGIWGTFTSPYTSGSGGGGTSTEGVAIESGSLTLVNGDVVYVVDSTSITHTYYLKIDGLFAGGLHSNWQHTSGTQSGGTFPNAQDGKYTLEYEESAYPFNHVKIAELTVGRKKVFSNFW